MKIIKNILRVLVIIFLLFSGFNLFGNIYAKFSPKINIKSANSFYMYDKDKTLIYHGSSIGNNTWVNLEDMGDYAVKATLSVEDKDFFNHNGFNYLRIIKAIYENIKHREIVQGASTITQQYAKNLFLSFDKTWQRKWKEMWLTFTLEGNYNKDEILEGYLNTINYGNGCYGIASASKYYFNKDVKDLNLAQISILVGIPNSPSNYSPNYNYDLSKERQEVVLNRMVDNGYITENEKDIAYNTKLEFYNKHDTYNLTTLSYYKDAVIKELETISSVPDNYIETNGLKIYTNLDMLAQTSLEDGLKENKKVKNSQSAKVMIRNKDGAIIALVGGINYEESSFNRATDSIRQPGSLVKPFLYYKALEQGFTASSSFESAKTTFNFSDKDSYTPTNINGTYANKKITMAQALAYSDNIYAVKTHLFLGEEKLVEILKKLNITTPLSPSPSLALGTYEVNIIELAGAYATLANEGMKIKPHLINEVYDMNDNLLYKYENKDEVRLLDEKLTFIINELLTGTYDPNLIDYTYPTCINLLDNITHKYAIKSGSTDTDAWVIGYNKDYVLASWSGYDDNKKIENSIVSNNKTSWIQTMEMYLKDKKDSWYKIPEGVVGVLTDPTTGEVATEDSKHKKILYYVKGTEPNSNKEIDDLIKDMVN